MIFNVALPPNADIRCCGWMAARRLSAAPTLTYRRCSRLQCGGEIGSTCTTAAHPAPMATSAGRRSNPRTGHAAARPASLAAHPVVGRQSDPRAGHAADVFGGHLPAALESVGMTALAVSLVRCCCGVTLPLASTGTGRSSVVAATLQAITRSWLPRPWLRRSRPAAALPA